MKDTTYTLPGPVQASDGGGKGASPCNNTLAAIGSGGVYSTRRHDALDATVPLIGFYARSNQADRMQTLIYQRAQLRRVIGMDVPGKADALGMGWVYMAPKMADRGLFKTGGGGGFITYMAMIPQSNVGALWWSPGRQIHAS